MVFFVKGDVFAKGGPSVYIAAGGIRCDLTFLDGQMEFTVETALRGDSKGIYLESGVYGQASVSTLAGKLFLFAEVGICPACAEYLLEIWDYSSGFGNEWMLFEWYTSKLYLYTEPEKKAAPKPTKPAQSSKPARVEKPAPVVEESEPETVATQTRTEKPSSASESTSGGSSTVSSGGSRNLRKLRQVCPLTVKAFCKKKRGDGLVICLKKAKAKRKRNEPGRAFGDSTKCRAELDKVFAASARASSREV